MSATPRPNLSGLFNGSAPPDRSSSIAEALGPRGVRLSAVTDEPAPAVQPPVADAPRVEAAPPVPPVRVAAPSTPPEYYWPAPSWLDPVKAIEHYFSFLQTVLEANQRFAVSLVSTAVMLPQRAKSWL